MTDTAVNQSQYKAANFAGLAYILVMVLAMLKVSFIEPALIIPGNDTHTVSNIVANELLFRTGIIVEIIMYVLVIFLSIALYITLKPVNKNLSLTAMVLRIAEGVTGVIITILSGIIPLLLLNTEGFATDQLPALVRLFLDVRVAGLDIVLVFIGFGGTLFCYLFLKSKYIPSVLAAWGIFTYLSMLILALFSILFPDHPEIIETILYSIGGLFEIIFGFWLFLKGIKISEVKENI